MIAKIIKVVIRLHTINPHHLLVLQVNYVSGCPNVLCTTTSGFAAAIAAAKQSDFVVYVGGINRNFEGEGNDRADIALFGLQSTLIQMYVTTAPRDPISLHPITSPPLPSSPPTPITSPSHHLPLLIF